MQILNYLCECCECRLFFESGLKVGLFGVANEGNGSQYTYTLPEGTTPGKGGNATMSLVYHHVFERGHIRGARHLILQCDNSAGVLRGPQWRGVCVLPCSAC